MTPGPAAGGSRDLDPDELVLSERLSGRPLLLLLDVDGTLAPIALHPSLARVPDDTRRVVAFLATRDDIVVVLVSGRAAHDARRLVGVEHLWTIGNHGAEVMDPDGDVIVDPAVSRYAEAVADTARELQPLLSAIKGVLLENKTWTLSVHYRMADEAVLPRLRGVVEGIAAHRGLRVTAGKKVLELRPPVQVDKGTAVLRLATELGARHDRGSILFAGDDETDEDAFRVLRAERPATVTVHVGDHPSTSAEFRLADPGQVRALLERIAQETSSHR